MAQRVMEDRSLGELFGELTDDLRLLLRHEVDLVQAEMREKLSHTVRTQYAWQWVVSSRL